MLVMMYARVLAKGSLAMLSHGLISEERPASLKCLSLMLRCGRFADICVFFGS